ncbi:C40 family peptidase [Sphaerimonospora cavernae]|uniref:C40 family peptidase n=1 Tax=Sphaerimonospora cavernae TaxID=1740611 RepID=A0ABV6U4D1_9ACTN
MLDHGRARVLVRPRRTPADPVRRAVGLRRTISLIAVLLASILLADVVILIRLDGLDGVDGPGGMARAGGPGVRRAYGHGQYVAAAERATGDRLASGTPEPSGEPGKSGDDAAGRGGASDPVAPLKQLIRPHLFVVSAHPLAPDVVAGVRSQKGVKAAEVTDAAEVHIDGKRVQTMGVDPSTFRAYTPSKTAGSDGLWQNVAAGDVAVSFELGHDGGVELGSTVDGAGLRMRVGAYATVGMGSIAAVVSRRTARSLGIPEGNAMVVSAPDVDSAKLRRQLLKLLPKGSQVATINPVVVAPRGSTAWPASAFMSSQQLQVALRAAVGKVGRPYAWGAEGPNSFDCSGLVQWAYRQAGVRMPRVAAQQWATGPQISLSQARPGDLLFWRNDPTNPRYISHVAIYWGDGKMLHAPRTGDVVKIAPIYTKNLAGVVRVSPAVSARVR